MSASTATGPTLETKPSAAPASTQRNRGSRRRRLLRIALIAIAVWIVLVLGLNLRKLPPGTHIIGDWSALDPATTGFLVDTTVATPEGPRREQQIFDALFELIERAETYLVLDFFLINEFAGDPEDAPRRLSSELINAIADAKRRRPALEVMLITDPINRVYGSERHPGFERLQQLGVQVVETRLDALRDSNPAYSAIFRALRFRWLGNRVDGGFLPNPIDPGDDTTLRSYLRLLNFKANHRKVAIAGRGVRPPIALVTSANPHDASSGHSNVALRFEGNAALDLLHSELQVAAFSGTDWTERSRDWVRGGAGPGPLPDRVNGALRVLTEGAIRDAVLAAINRAGEGDRVDAAMFYMGHRGIIKALLAAAERGASVRLILDPNRDSFGRTRGGVPNRSVAHELVSKSRRAADRGRGRPIEVRWYATSGEQFHTKLTAVHYSSARTMDGVPAPVGTGAILGSANFTRRNLDDFNLEANVELALPGSSAIAAEIDLWFAQLWANQGADYTVDYQTFEDTSVWSTLKYRLPERSGLSTF